MTTHDTTTDDARSQTPVMIITNSAKFSLGQIVVGIPDERDRSFRRIVTDDSDLS